MVRIPLKGTQQDNSLSTPYNEYEYEYKYDILLSFSFFFSFFFEENMIYSLIV